LGGDVKDRVIAILVEENVEVKMAPVPPGAPIEWNLVATVRSPLPVKINVQKRSGTNRLGLVMGVAFAPFHLDMIRRMKVEERRAFIADMLKGILLMCPECVVATQPPVLEEASSIIVTKEVKVNERLEDELPRSMRVLANAFTYIILTLNAKFGPPPKREAGEGGIHVM